MKTTRRTFMKTAGISAAALAGAASAAAQNVPKTVSGPNRLKLGMASYTFRKFGIDDTLAMTKRLGLDYIAFKDFHLAMDSTEAQIKEAARKAKDAGLDLYGCGVVYMNDESQVSRAFDYAKTAGMRIIIGVPDHALLPLAEKKVIEYDIKLAIHNHGPGDKRYPSPQSVYEKISGMDPRMGLCIDVGHTQRIGIDPSQPVRQYFSRLHDVHIKDVTASASEGSTCEIGRGVIDIPKLVNTLLELGYNGIASLEFEKDESDPLPGSAESIGYIRGVLSSI